jgi:hypothetical protein
MTQRCIDCSAVKEKKRVGISRVYRDEDGHTWSGATCGICTDAEAGLGSKDVFYPPKFKKCIECGDRTHNYFRCTTCANTAQATWEDVYQQGAMDYRQV